LNLSVLRGATAFVTLDLALLYAPVAARLEWSTNLSQLRGS